MSIVPIPLFLLTADRCLSMHFTQLKELRHGLFIVCCAFTVVAVLGTLWRGGLAELPLNATAIEGCQTLTCTLTLYNDQPMGYYKTVAGVVNTVLVIYFMMLLRAREVRSQKVRAQTLATVLKARLVRAVIIIETVVSTVPFLVCQVLEPVSYMGAHTHLFQHNISAIRH